MIPQTKPTTILSLVLILFKSSLQFVEYIHTYYFHVIKSISIIIGLSIMNLFKILTLVAALAIIANAAKHNVTQLNQKTFNETIINNDFTLLYVYSSSCKYCSQFTPLFQSLSNQKYQRAVAFAKIDGNLYQQQIKMFEITSFPTVMLFWKGFLKPIYFREERNKENIRKFLKQNFQITPFKTQNPTQMSIYQQIQQKWVFYYGYENSEAYKMLGLAWKRDRYFRWMLIQSQIEKIMIGSTQIAKKDFSIQKIQATIKKNFARLHELDQQPWAKIFKNKQLGIVYINTQQNKRVPKLLQKMAQKYPQTIFLNLPSNHPEYKSALKVIGVLDQQNIIAVDKKADGVFVAKQPYTEENLTDFIQKVKKYQWPVYRKTERTTNQNKLTRQNYYEKMATSQDVLLFLYNRNQRISKDLVDLFNFLIKKFETNKNLLLLRCDVSNNELQQYLGFMVDKTPKLVFFRNRMKDKPIHYYGGKISAKNTIQFIMQNTTFDWEDQWGQL